MCRVNAFLEAGNEAGRRVSVGGRGRSDSCWAWLNTDTADGERAIKVRAEVCGTVRSQDRRKPGTDSRTAHFEIELPEPGQHVKVRLREQGARMADLARIGAMLCGLKGAQQIAQGDEEAGVATIEKAAEIVAELETNLANLPDVELPGGVSLKHALACVEFVRRLNQGQAESAN